MKLDQCNLRNLDVTAAFWQLKGSQIGYFSIPLIIILLLELKFREVIAEVNGCVIPQR